MVIGTLVYKKDQKYTSKGVEKNSRELHFLLEEKEQFEDGEEGTEVRIERVNFDIKKLVVGVNYELIYDFKRMGTSTYVNLIGCKTV